jgi:uncharacterized membrane protein
MIATIVSRIRKPGRGFQASTQAVAAISATTAEFVRFINLALSVIFSYTAVKLPLYPSDSPVSFVIFVVAIVAIAVLTGFVRMKRTHDALKREGKLEGFEGWNGFIYKNPKDPRLWVPKMIGVGYTFNFAHPLAWPLFILILSLPVIVVLVIFMSQ